MYEYGLSQEHAQGQAQASTSSASPSMQPPSALADFRNGQLQQQQQQQPQQPYPYGYDSYPPPVGPSSYDYGFQRGPMQSGMEGMPSTYGNGNGNGNASGNWESPYNGASSSSHDRSREPPPWMMGEGNGIYGQMGMHGDMGRGSSGAIDGNGNGHGHGHGHGGAGLGLGGDEESWRRNGTNWGHDFGKPPGLDTGMEKALETVSFTFTPFRYGKLTSQLRSNINDLVESIRPYGASTVLQDNIKLICSGISKQSSTTPTTAICSTTIRTLSSLNPVNPIHPPTPHASPPSSRIPSYTSQTPLITNQWTW